MSAPSLHIESTNSMIQYSLFSVLAQHFICLFHVTVKCVLHCLANIDKYIDAQNLYARAIDIMTVIQLIF